MVQACSKVPKFTVMTNGSFGAGNYGMCGRAFDPRYIFSWPNSQISVMGAEQAANTLVSIKLTQLAREGLEATQEQIDSIRSKITDDYTLQSSAYYATSELWDDGMVDPVATRNALGIAIGTSLNAPLGEGGYGVLRL